MIVSELIDKLKTYPAQTIILGRGYESGYNSIENVELQNVLHIPDGAWYDGEYQEPASYNSDKGYEQVTAITLC